MQVFYFFVLTDGKTLVILIHYSKGAVGINLCALFYCLDFIFRNINIL